MRDRAAGLNPAKPTAMPSSPKRAGSPRALRRWTPRIPSTRLPEQVPGYAISRLELAAGNPQRTELVQIAPAGIVSHPELIAPAGNGLFTSGTLGRYSATLNSVVESHRGAVEPIGAD